MPTRRCGQAVPEGVCAGCHAGFVTTKRKGGEGGDDMYICVCVCEGQPGEAPTTTLWYGHRPY